MKLKHLSYIPEEDTSKKVINVHNLYDLLKYFPNKFGKAAQTAFNNDRLEWHGHIVSSKLDSKFYKQVEKDILSEPENTMSTFDVDLSSIKIYDDHWDELIEDGQSVELDFSYFAEELKVEYVAYDKKNDCILIGFDMWMEYEDNMNTAIDDFCQEHKLSDEVAAVVAQASLDQFIKHKLNFQGLLVSVYANDGGALPSEILNIWSGGFHVGAKTFLHPSPDLFQLT